jgi:cytidyltransferase-like protein
MRKVVVSGIFEKMDAREFRFLHEASRIGSVTVFMWSDHAIQSRWGRMPTLPQEERLYFLNALRYVEKVEIAPDTMDPDSIIKDHFHPALPNFMDDTAAASYVWVVDPTLDTEAKRAFCKNAGIGYHVVPETDLQGFPSVPESSDTNPGRNKVVVTGCYDWLHSGHVRFFEEADELGDLYVVVGNDANVRMLKGEGHPLFCEEQRRYMVASIRHVKQALISTGFGWMDAAPEIDRIKPDFYVVNEDGDRPEKRQFCAEHGLELIVLKRIPKEGLPKRQSTDLRGF